MYAPPTCQPSAGANQLIRHLRQHQPRRLRALHLRNNAHLAQSLPALLHLHRSHTRRNLHEPRYPRSPTRPLSRSTDAEHLQCAIGRHFGRRVAAGQGEGGEGEGQGAGSEGYQFWFGGCAGEKVSGWWKRGRVVGGDDGGGSERCVV